MTAIVRIPTSAGDSKSKFHCQAAAATLTIDAPAATERLVLTSVYANGPASAFTVNLGSVTLNFGDHPGVGDRIEFADGYLVGDAGSQIVLTLTGATQIVALGYVTNDLG